MRRIDVERLSIVILRSGIASIDERKEMCKHLFNWFEEEHRKFHSARRRGERLFQKANARAKT